jgi:leader peptidase (prepilin peptidase)/N-methyltransferase
MYTTATAQPARAITPLVAAGRGAAAAVVVVGAVLVSVRLGPPWLAVVAAFLPLTAAARVDAAEGRLPNRLVLLSAMPVLLVCVLDPFVDRLDAAGVVVAGAALLAGPLLALHLVAPAAMGFGDVKAAASIGATLGLISPELSLWTLCGACAVTAGWGVVRRRHQVPMGPGLVLAALVVVFVGAAVGIEAAAWR